MLGFEGRHAVSSSTGRRALLGAFKESVVVQDLLTGVCSAAVETTFDFGGDRLALSDELDGVVAAAYHVHGLALYGCTSGREQWRRKDLKKVQRITLSRDGLTAYCGREGSSLEVVDLRTGNTKRTIRGARGLYESAFDGVQFLDATNPKLVNDAGQRLFSVRRETFAFLDISFAPGLLVVSEAGGAVRCIEIASGKERWRYKPRTGRHVLHLGYRDAEPSLLGVEWQFERGGAKRLMRWSLDNGDVLESLLLGEPADCCFGLSGEVIVLSSGDVLPTSTRKTGRGQ